MQAYDEATETVTVSVRAPQRECQTTDYARRSTVEGSLDTGSIPVYSTRYKAAGFPQIKPEVLHCQRILVFNFIRKYY